MQTVGNFNSQFGRELPTERYLEAITELAKKDEQYVFTCYLGLVQGVLETVIGTLDTMDEDSDTEVQAVEVCQVAGMNLARMMVTHCVALGTLIRLFTTTRQVDDDSQRIFDSFDDLVVVPGSSAPAKKKSIVANLKRYFNEAKFEVCHLMKRRIVLTRSINAYCLRNIKKSLHVGKNITAEDAGLVIGHLPEEVIFRAFSLQFGVGIGPEHVDTLEHLSAFVGTNGRQVYENYWKPRGFEGGTYYVEAFASLEAFITGLARHPFDKMMQVVWYATHRYGTGDDSETRVRFLLKVPDVNPEGTGSTAKEVVKLLGRYDEWIASDAGLLPRLVGVTLTGPEDDAVDVGGIKAFFNELHNRVFIERDDLLVVHVSMDTLRYTNDDLMETNRWVGHWVEIKTPLKRLHGYVSNELLINYGKIKRLALDLDETKLIRFCYSGLELRIGERDPAFAAPFMALKKESFEAFKSRKLTVLHQVVSAYLASIFNHKNAKLRLGSLTQVNDEILGLIAGSENVYVDMLPGWTIRETIQNLNITPRQLTIAKELLLVESRIGGKQEGKASVGDLMVIEKAVEIHTREKGGTQMPRQTILAHSPIGHFVEMIPSQFVLGDGGGGTERIGIVKEYELYNDLVGLPALLDENVQRYAAFALTTRFQKGDNSLAPPEPVKGGARQEVAALPVVSEPPADDPPLKGHKDDPLDDDLLLSHLFDDDY
ncbi:hypothetical protein [Desulfoluna spongiiphila]|uniref:Uncharacterized protein n=1 Tax=Desulfoluna spongiiphila TaxID=419481 RepID=A0A1G5DLF6_9BACT|nr:hypothetical protein [Desulfoluna spongiiphila]SCY15476.1 hypothetical protein SAMN05216233_104257 [Desulfoluna spongiiphila]VVS95067.1 consensus disorder prediction [Desulfoluna spongiiphila]